VKSPKCAQFACYSLLAAISVRHPLPPGTRHVGSGAIPTSCRRAGAVRKEIALELLAVLPQHAYLTSASAERVYSTQQPASAAAASSALSRNPVRQGRSFAILSEAKKDKLLRAGVRGASPRVPVPACRAIWRSSAARAAEPPLPTSARSKAGAGGARQPPHQTGV
jgi:hypothetical protein